MLKKKILTFMISILACCSVVSGCSFTAKEETEQSTEKKLKKKNKKKVSESTTEKESKTEGSEIEETHANTQNAEEVKKALIDSLDDFLSADSAEIVLKTAGSSLDSTLVVDKVRYNEDILYMLSMQEEGMSTAVYILTDGKEAYISQDGGANWQKSEHESNLSSGALISSSYVSYIGFIYAALDAGLEYSYDAKNKSYLIQSDASKVANINTDAIRSKVKNSDKLKEYDMFWDKNKTNLISYSDVSGIASKNYEFYVEDNVFYIVETLYNNSKVEVDKSTVTRIKGKEANSIEEEFVVKTFKELKGEVPNQ